MILLGDSQYLSSKLSSFKSEFEKFDSFNSTFNSLKYKVGIIKRGEYDASSCPCPECFDTRKVDEDFIKPF